jgi:Fur family ferric uptake transcriptional regulator
MASASEYQRAEKIFREFLAARGQRLTTPRRAVLRAVTEMKTHFGRNRLGEKLKGSGVHRATMFRTLPLLVEAGILHRMREKLDHWHYETVIGHRHHGHLLCVGCGRIIEFCSPAVQRERKRLCRRHDFQEKSHTFIIRGLCARCRRERGRRSAGGKQR